MSSVSYLAIDLGGSNTRLGLFASLESAEFLPLASFPTQQTYADQLALCKAVLQQQGIGELAGAGVSVAARVAKDGRSLVFGPNLPEYIHQPFAADLEACLGCRVRLGHDTVCGLLGEWRFGALRAIERSAYLTVSTGTGAAIQLSKAGTRLTSSIEIGHQILDGNERRCLCGQVGCLETFTGGRQLELRYGRPLAELVDEAFWQVFIEKLALGLLNLAQLTRIDAIAVGGAIALQHPTLRERVQTCLHERLQAATLPLLPAVLGEHAPLVGAAALWSVAEDTLLH